MLVKGGFWLSVSVMVMAMIRFIFRVVLSGSVEVSKLLGSG